MLRGSRIALLDRFTVDGWTAAGAEHRPRTVSLVPTALRMVLDATWMPTVHEHLRSVVVGHRAASIRTGGRSTTQPGGPPTAYRCSRRRPPPRSGRCVAGWNNLADHEEFAAAKRGASAGARGLLAARLSTLDDGRDLGIDTRVTARGAGRSARPPELGGCAHRPDPGAVLDAYVLPLELWPRRSTILRGWVQVPSEVVRSALERIDGVAEAAVVACPTTLVAVPSPRRATAVCCHFTRPGARGRPAAHPLLALATNSCLFDGGRRALLLTESWHCRPASPQSSARHGEAYGVMSPSLGCSAIRRCPPSWSWRVRCAISPTPAVARAVVRRSAKHWCRRCLAPATPRLPPAPDDLRPRRS